MRPDDLAERDEVTDEAEAEAEAAPAQAGASEQPEQAFNPAKRTAGAGLQEEEGQDS